MYSIPISIALDELPLRLVQIADETAALSDVGVFTTPIASAWAVVDSDGHTFGTVIEYKYIPSTWSDENVKPQYRQSATHASLSPIAPSLVWVRLSDQQIPSLARSKTESLQLMSLEYSRLSDRPEHPRMPMSD